MRPAEIASIVISLVALALVIAMCVISAHRRGSPGLLSSWGVSAFTSDVDGKAYSVRTRADPGNMQTAANYLAELSGRVDRLADFMVAGEIPSREVAARLRDRWSRCSLRETGPRTSSAAFTVDKDREIQLCIRDSGGNFEDPNTSMFVLLHELAHVMSISYGHEPEFYANFDAVTKAAVKLGVYEPQDFTKSPGSYCGAAVTATPCSNGACTAL